MNPSIIIKELDFEEAYNIPVEWNDTKNEEQLSMQFYKKYKNIIIDKKIRIEKLSDWVI